MSQLAGGGIKLEINCNEPLRQHVVNLSSKPASFTKNCCELPANLTHAVTVYREGGEPSQHQKQDIKPYCPVKEWLQIKRKRRARFIPDTVVVACHDAKGIVASR